MKKHFYTLIMTLFVLVTFISCNSNKSSSAGNSKQDSAGVTSDKGALPVMSFEEEFHDFGKLKAGEKVTYAFKFKNAGKSVLIISNVGTSCGCTISDYPKKPIQPGDAATIDVSFNSEGKHGLQTKVITVFSNANPPSTTLRIQAQVEEPEDK